jgi:hypothetical protein
MENILSIEIRLIEWKEKISACEIVNLFKKGIVIYSEKHCSL